MWRMFRDARILGVLGLALVAVVIAILNATVYSPESTVLRYLDALGDGRQADVEAQLWGVGVSPELDVRVPANPAHRPTNPSIVSVQFVTADVAFVTARVTLDGVSSDVQFSLTKDTEWSLFADWQFTLLPIGIIDFTSTANSGGSVNGAPGIDAAIAFMPSVATVGPPSVWFETEPQEVRVDSFSKEYAVDVPLRPSPALEAEMNDAVREYLDECAAQKTLVPARCPFAGFTSMRIASGPTWTITSYPEITVEESDGDWVVSGAGKVKLVVSLVDFATEKTEDYSESMSFTVSGTIEGLDTDKPRLVLSNTVER